MPSPDNIVVLQDYRQPDRQQIIDDIGARAFLMIRHQAEANDIPVKDVLTEHLLGISLVMASVEGTDEVRRLLNQIQRQLDANDCGSPQND